MIDQGSLAQENVRGGDAPLTTPDLPPGSPRIFFASRTAGGRNIGMRRRLASPQIRLLGWVAFATS
jgi:hypothetical protein